MARIGKAVKSVLQKHAGVRDVDHGWMRIKDELRKLNGAYTKVGVQEGEQHRGENQQAVDMSLIAAANELGTADGRIPSRPFMGQGFDQNVLDLEQFKTRLIKNIYSGRINARQALGMLGARHQGQIQRSLTTGDWVPNAPYTLARKFPKTRPLINTGQLRTSIRHVEVFP